MIPRAGLHAGAYTLVQALPISFFFFGQLKDTRYNHVNSPNRIYPSFNTAMAYAAFFITILLPILLLFKIYQKYNVDSKVNNFKMEFFKRGYGNNIEFQNYKDPLWGGKTAEPASYGFGGAVFLLPVIAGFFLGFFIFSYPWQFTGLLLFLILFLSFAAASNHFDRKVFKYYFIGITGLMVVYLLVHAGIGSNRALSTYDQWNTGYLGIGLIYAMLLTALIFSGFLLYKTFWGLYDCHRKNGWKFLTDKDSGEQMKVAREGEEEGEKLRGENNMGRPKKSTIMKSRLHSAYENPNSEDRMLQKDKEDDGAFMFGRSQR